MAIDWKAVRVDFESGSFTVNEISKRYGCAAGSIRKRASREGWEDAGRAPGKSKRKREGSDRLGGAQVKRRAKGPRGSAVGHGEGREPLDADDHRSLWRGVKKRLLKGLQSEDLQKGLEELKVAKAAGEVLTSVIKGEREACGLDGFAWGGREEGAGQKPGVTADDAKDAAREMASLTVPPGADEAVEGE